MQNPNPKHNPIALKLYPKTITIIFKSPIIIKTTRAISHKKKTPPTKFLSSFKLQLHATNRTRAKTIQPKLKLKSLKLISRFFKTNLWRAKKIYKRCRKNRTTSPKFPKLKHGPILPTIKK